MKDSNNTPVVTRFAPSPTGFLQLGNYRTALFSYLYARQNDGVFVLRIEDTDKARNKKEYEDDIVESFKWLGLEYDQFYRQSDRADIHKKYLQKLIDDGRAYVSKEAKPVESTDGSPKKLREEVIRFKNPNKKITFTDLIRGEVTFDTTELGDFVIAKSLDEPVFHLAVVVDDFDMGITHVIRGEDHISNTPRQILIQEAIGAPRPIYAHLPLILAPDRSKLSKRNGAISVRDCRVAGYEPEAVINFLALLGWNPGDDREVFSLAELIKEFKLEKVQKSGAIFNKEKFNSVNKKYLHALSLPERAGHIAVILKKHGVEIPLETITLLAPVLTERVSTWGELDGLVTAGEFNYLWHAPAYPKEKLVWKAKTVEKIDGSPDAQSAFRDSPTEEACGHISHVATLLEKTSEADFQSAESIKNVIWTYAEEKGRGNVLWPLRMALSGKDKSPDPFTLLSLLGKEEALKRIKTAIQLVG